METLYRYNDFGSKFYILLRGVASAWVPISESIVAEAINRYLQEARAFIQASDTAPDSDGFEFTF